MWEDPFPKPCYLFALVAGKLSVKEQGYVTKSGKKVTLRIYVQEANIDKVDFAMQSLVNSMKWDEVRRIAWPSGASLLKVAAMWRGGAGDASQAGFLNDSSRCDVLQCCTLCSSAPARTHDLLMMVTQITLYPHGTA